MQGIYALVIRLDRDINVNIGALGKIALEKGLYVYAGSAQTGLEQRVKRHLRKEKRLFWHIDYLLDNGAAKIEKVLCKQAFKTEECTLANEINKRGKPVNGFGCSDCHCKSHLFRIDNAEFLSECLQELKWKHSAFM